MLTENTSRGFTKNVELWESLAWLGKHGRIAEISMLKLLLEIQWSDHFFLEVSSGDDVNGTGSLRHGRFDFKHLSAGLCFLNSNLIKAVKQLQERYRVYLFDGHLNYFNSQSVYIRWAKSSPGKWLAICYLNDLMIKEVLKILCLNQHNNPSKLLFTGSNLVCREIALKVGASMSFKVKNWGSYHAKEIQNRDRKIDTIVDYFASRPIPKSLFFHILIIYSLPCPTEDSNESKGQLSLTTKLVTYSPQEVGCIMGFKDERINVIRHQLECDIKVLPSVSPTLVTISVTGRPHQVYQAINRIQYYACRYRRKLDPY